MTLFQRAKNIDFSEDSVQDLALFCVRQSGDLAAELQSPNPGPREVRAAVSLTYSLFALAAKASPSSSETSLSSGHDAGLFSALLAEGAAADVRQRRDPKTLGLIAASGVGKVADHAYLHGGASHDDRHLAMLCVRAAAPLAEMVASLSPNFTEADAIAIFSRRDAAVA